MVKLQGRKGEESRFGKKAEVANDNNSRLFASSFDASGVCVVGIITAIVVWR